MSSYYFPRPHWAPTEREEYEERAAIREIDGGDTRARAEWLAAFEVEVRRRQR